jgi:UDP-2-acetamido-3-amino-2,3-dideoxy-glucuronate N-acetyltransferase
MENRNPDLLFVHPQGLCESKSVGSGTRIWAFAHILPGARIGTECNICDHVFIENDVIIGAQVTVKCGVQLWDGLRIGNKVFIGPNATFSNDRYPKSKHRPDSFLVTVIEDEVSIGANATILPGLRLGRGAMVGAGSVVTRDVPPFARVVGNPARIVGYQSPVGDAVQSMSPRIDSLDVSGSNVSNRLDLGVGACYLEKLPYFNDLRGGLTPLEFAKGLPFKPARIFMVYEVPSQHVRGEHAHKECEQYLVVAHGEVTVLLDDGKNQIEVRLDNRLQGLYLAPMVWGVQYKFSHDCVLMVIASHLYDSSDYIRNYQEFILASVSLGKNGGL